ncbi:Sugar lactone lactonase YvrE [Reichenbachiella faecimaris]|uniref:Sugar lactone lactonase YvrE n=1 Tax=Reichenbachiella faecimaris TaxID=692418 RepID=A0A1W2GNG5_REIFA|nr:SMP-30/gluconolactonase/LRE family protein [Reichenbachiella faecimaris]SMD38187.1 Sugar lactone lactonase YvrE [Reichenbachiella faecimaris]
MRNSFSYLILAAFILSCTQKSEWYIVSDFAFVGDFTQGLEGPAVDAEGNLFFVNPKKSGTIGKISIAGELEIYVDSLPNGSVANGIRFDPEGLMYLADYINHNILTIDPLYKVPMVYAHDSTMNQPNDLAIASDGTIYASDPNWAESTGNLWRVDLDGQFDLLESNMGTTNGVEVAPGDSLLYVNESVQRKVWVYDLSKTGTLSNKRLLIEFADHGLDGMRTDIKGNLYIARYGKRVIAIVSPQGELINEVKLKGQKPTNIAFGGKDGKTCYVTCQDRGYIESFRAPNPGRSFSFRK